MLSTFHNPRYISFTSVLEWVMMNAHSFSMSPCPGENGYEYIYFNNFTIMQKCMIVKHLLQRLRSNIIAQCHIASSAGMRRDESKCLH